MTVISLSKYTKALIEQLKKVKQKPQPDELSKLSVSQTVTFFALAYERIRNAIEYREAHLIRRAAIERIVRRRLSMNPKGAGEAENVIRELLWARYFPNESLGAEDINNVQNILDTYLLLMDKLLVGQAPQQRTLYSQFLIHLLTCEIEGILLPLESKQYSLFTFFMFQVLKNKVKIEKISEEEKNAAFYVALERGFNKSDLPYLRYHLFILTHKPLTQYKKDALEKLVSTLPKTFSKIDAVIQNPNSDRIRRFVKHHIPPFLILFELFKRRDGQIEQVLANKELLWEDIELLAREKYAYSQSRLQTLAVKAIIYIFVTKMLIALILEYPVSLFLYGEVNYTALAVNTLFPPLLMFLIATFTKIPGQENTKRLHERIVDIVDADKEFETTVSFVTRQRTIRRPVLIFGFTIFYSLTFLITFGLLFQLLRLLHFNVISMGIFMFFISVVTFFAYRIRQTAKEYQLPEKETFFRPFADFFFMPILSLGKFLSQGLSRLNFFAVLFDFIVEAPFKLIIEVVEEWIGFVRQKRDEII